MKTLRWFSHLGLLALLWVNMAQADFSPQKSLLGKFLVSSVNGTVSCVSDGRVFDAKKGDVFTARGARVECGPKSNAILVFSNGTGVYADENTTIEVLRFEQEFFAPNNNLRVEPSNSSTIVRVKNGRLVISTPRLQSATTMVYETAHAAVGIRGDRVLIESDERQTHVAMIAGNATVNPRDAEGRFVSIGKRLVTGQEAFIKYTVAADAQDVAATPPAEAALAPEPTAARTALDVVVSATPAKPAPAAPVRLATIETDATVVEVAGDARIKVTGTRSPGAVTVGAKLARGTTLTTAADGDVFLQVFSGTVAHVRPNSSVELTSLSVTQERGVVTKESALLDLRAGTIVSIIDPSKRAVNDYAVRTPQGLARAEGTSFVTTVRDEGSWIASTADTVGFATRSGTRYEILAGQVSVTAPGGEPQPPVPVASATAADARLGGVIREAFSSVAAVVRNNLGGLSPANGANLLAQVAGVAAAALPVQAAAIAGEAVSAATAAPGATAAQAAIATASITRAVVAAAPDHAAAIAVAALTAAQAHDTTVGAAATKGAPAQAGPIAAAVAEALVGFGRSASSATSGEALAAVAAAITSSSTNQAAPVAAATLQALLQSADSTPSVLTRQAALIGSTVTAAAPQQAVPVASILMTSLLQRMTDATPQVVGQAGTILAGAVISIVPAQAQEVATAVMQLIMQTYPAATRSWVGDTAGLLGAGLTQAVPARADAIIAGISAASGLSIADLQGSLSRYAAEAGEWTRTTLDVNRIAGASFQRAAGVAGVLAAADDLTRAARTIGGGIGAADGASRGTSIVIGNNADVNNATSIVITQFSPGLVNQLTADIEAAQAAQTSVQFSVDTAPNGGTTVRPDPVVPRTIPPDFVVSPAR